MSTHGLMVETDKVTYRRVGNEWKKFKYTEAITNHNNSKHWVDDVNQRRHAPIGLEDVWATQWWPHRQFTFLLSVAEVNANNSLARAKNESAEHQITFRKLLAEEMMYNKLTESGGVRNSPIRARKRSRQSLEPEHELVKKPKWTGKYDAAAKCWTQSPVEYLKHACKTCKRKIRTYCICNKACPMCSACFAQHCINVNSTV